MLAGRRIPMPTTIVIPNRLEPRFLRRRRGRTLVSPAATVGPRKAGSSRLEAVRNDIWMSGRLSQLLTHQFIHQLRIGLAFGQLHHLAHKESRHSLLSRAVLLN